MILDISLANRPLYIGCEITETGGKLNLVTPPQKAANIIGRNTERIIAEDTLRDEIILTGSMAIWAYLIVFHIVVHRYRKVWYADGYGNKILIAAHG